MDRIRLPPFRKEWHTGSSIVDRHSCHLLEKGGTRFPQSRPLSTTRLPLHFFSSSLSCTASVPVVVVVRALACVCFCLLRTHPLLLCIMASVQGVFLNVAAISSSSACIAPVAQQSVSRLCLCLDFFFFFFWVFSGFFFLSSSSSSFWAWMREVFSFLLSKYLGFHVSSLHH